MRRRLRALEEHLRHGGLKDPRQSSHLTPSLKTADDALELPRTNTHI